MRKGSRQDIYLNVLGSLGIVSMNDRSIRCSGDLSQSNLTKPHRYVTSKSRRGNGSDNLNVLVVIHGIFASPPPCLHVLKFNPQCDIIWSGAFGR